MTDPPSLEDLRVARAKAEVAEQQAAELEREYRSAKRRAGALRKHYEDMVLIAQGQQEIPYA